MSGKNINFNVKKINKINFYKDEIGVDKILVFA